MRQLLFPELRLYFFITFLRKGQHTSVSVLNCSYQTLKLIQGFLRTITKSCCVDVFSSEPLEMCFVRALRTYLDSLKSSSSNERILVLQNSF